MVLGELCGPAESGLEMGQPRANDVSGIGPDWMVTCGAPDVVRQVEDGADRLLMAQFHVNGVPVYVDSDGMMMASDCEAQSRLADVGTDAVHAVARGALVQAGLASTRDSEGMGEPPVNGSTPMAAAAVAADAPATERRADALATERGPPPGLEVKVPRAALQCASAPRLDSSRAGGAASGDVLDSTATAAAPGLPVVSLTSELQLWGDIVASRQQVGELAGLQVRACTQQVQLVQPLAEFVKNQMAITGALTETIVGLKEADKERADELRQLRATVAAQQQQLDAGAPHCRNDPVFLAEQHAGSSIAGGGDTQAAASVQAVRSDAQAATPIQVAKNGAPAACTAGTGKQLVATGPRAKGVLGGRSLGEALEAAALGTDTPGHGSTAAANTDGNAMASRLTGPLQGELGEQGEATALQNAARPAWAMKALPEVTAAPQLEVFDFKAPEAPIVRTPAAGAGNSEGLAGSWHSRTAATVVPGSSAGRPPGPAAFWLPLPPAAWLCRPYDRDEYNGLRSLLGEIEADPLTPRGLRL